MAERPVRRFRGALMTGPSDAGFNPLTSGMPGGLVVVSMARGVVNYSKKELDASRSVFRLCASEPALNGHATPQDATFPNDVTSGCVTTAYWKVAGIRGSRWESARSAGAQEIVDLVRSDAPSLHD